MKKSLERFSKGIHIEKLEKSEIETILKNYYNISFFPELYSSKKRLKNNLFQGIIYYTSKWTSYTH